MQQTIQPEIVPTTLRSAGGVQRFALNQDRPVHSALQGTTKPPVIRVYKSTFQVFSKLNSVLTKFSYFSKQLRARPEYREPRPQFEAKELQPIRRPQPQFDFVNQKPRQHHDHEVRE